MAPEGHFDRAARDALVREKMAAGAVPSTPAAGVWAGKGTDSTCAACGITITAIMYEFECETDEGAVFRMCQPCLYAWDLIIRDKYAPPPPEAD